MGTEKSLGLPDRFEPTHPSLSNPGVLMRLLSPIILILFGTVDRVRNQFPMSNAIAPQFIGDYLPRFTVV